MPRYPLLTVAMRCSRVQPSAKYFKEPVQWQKLQLWNYLDIVTNPMDLATVLRKLENRDYQSVAALRADVDLIWDNAILFNGEGSWIKKSVPPQPAHSRSKFRVLEAKGYSYVRSCIGA